MSHPRMRLIKTRRDARDRVAHALVAATDGGWQSPQLGSYLAEWLEWRRGRLESTTHESYRAMLRRYIVPHLGEYELTELTSGIVKRWCDQLRTQGGHGGKPLGFSTVRQTHSILHSALEDAVRENLLIVNPATRAAPPLRGSASTRTRCSTWNTVQLRTFLETVRGTRHDLAYHLAAATGMRRGEILGLRWSDVTSDCNELTVRSSLVWVNGQFELTTPKGQRVRRLRIDSTTAGMLAEHHETPEAHGGEWNLVFAEPDRQPVSPANMTVDFGRRVRKSPLPTIRLLDLRHTHATLLLEAGVPVTEVSARLGHAHPRTTMERYAHAIPAHDQRSADTYASAVYR